LPDRRDHLGGANAVADSEAGEAEDLRERPQNEHAVATRDILRHAFRVVGLVDVLEVGLVENGEDVLGHALEVRIEFPRVFVVPVGLFGAAMNTSFVRA
jgi:hypothetical protein